MTVDAEKPVSKGIGFLARGAAAYDACRGAAEIFHQHDAQRNRDCPELADGQWLNALISAHEATQRFGIEAAVGVGNERPGHAQHAWIAVERAIAELRQPSIEARREILADLADLLFHAMVIVEQP